MKARGRTAAPHPADQAPVRLAKLLRGAKASRKPAKLKPGVCFCCGCTDEFGCDAGCAWVDEANTLCSECERIGQAYLNWQRAVPT